MESKDIRDLIRDAQIDKATTLDLSAKSLTSLPPEISELKNLIELDISDNQLIYLPSEIFELRYLEQLDISSNQLTFLPMEISKLKKLDQLNISSNNLLSLPTGIFELKVLTKFHISYNQLSSLPPKISKLKSLVQLDLFNNRLSSLPPEISELKSLEQLDLSYNQLSSLPSEISELKSLEQLDLSYNQLSSLPPEVSELKNLVQLDISHNQLSSLPLEIFELKNLVKLDLSYNQLSSLPPEILKLDLDIDLEKRWKSNTIFLRGNSFENPPLEILKQGREAVTNYFMSLKDERKPLNEVKVLLVGEGGAGKTSMVKRLFGEPIDKNEPQTQGINIRKLIVKNGDREIKANFWDFGGQRIMHATHQFLLSKRSLYILVLDGRKDEKPEYWLKLIENFGGDSTVLVVINKIDENPAFELNRKFLQEKYPSIKGFYRLSCKSNEGVPEFLKALQEELTKVKHLEIKWPKSWFNVKSRIEHMCPRYPSTKVNRDCEHCNFIEYKQYEKICNEEGIKSEAAQNTLVDFLHDLGVIIHFRDIPLLNRYVLEPQWVTNGVYKIVTSKEIAESRGVLRPYSMLPEILKQRTIEDFYYPPNQYYFFVSLMKKFELSYDLDDRTVLLPASLEIQEPNFEFDYEGALKFIIEYDFLPPSVMPRFIVKMHRNIKDDLRWRTGAVLEERGFNSTAVIREDDEAKRISIYVNGNQKRDYFAVILRTFREINSSFEKLKVTEKIPLPDNPEVTMSYDHLIKLELKGIETYMPDGSDNEYNVSDLLGTVIYRSRERTLLEKILRIMEMDGSSEKETLKILRKLQEIGEESDTEDTLLEKLNKVVTVEPNFCGIDLRLNEIIKIYLKSKKSKSGN